MTLLDPPMQTPRAPCCHLHGLLLIAIVVTATPHTSSSPLSTFTMARASSATMVCALLPSSTIPLSLDLNCTTAGHERHRTYPSARLMSALAGGVGFLCAVGPSPTPALPGAVAMQWWDLAGSAVSKNVYNGRPFRALSSSGYRVCGVLDDGELRFWGRWRDVPASPAGVRFADVAVGDDFVCGIVEGGLNILCFGNDTVLNTPPGGRYDVVAAAGRRACALSTAGEIACWGSAPPKLGPDAAIGGFAALALGEDGVCALRVNGTVHCFGDGVAAPPGRPGDTQFVDVHAQGKAFCGLLMSNYSLVCWGGSEFDGNHLVFDRVLPGPCVPMSSCQCGVLPDSANLCAGSGYICVDCAFGLNANLKTQSPAKSRDRILMIAAATAVSCMFLVALLLLLLFFRSRRRRDNGSSLHEKGTENVGSGRVLGMGRVVENFTLSELRAATDGYSDERRIRSAIISWPVYRGTLADGRDVAIKRAEVLTPAFRSELSALSRANHKNVVRLLGFCDESGESALVYDFMSNGTLHDQLHSRDGYLAPPLASWHGRLAIALHAARGVEYMHAYAVPPIAHRGVTSGNILLDESWTAKITGFALSSPIPDTSSAAAADERGDDVRSFGVVLLELMTGRGAESAVDFAVPLITADEAWQVLDPRLPLPTPNEADALAYVGCLAADCVRPVGCERPSMTDVADELQRAAAACAPATPPRSEAFIRPILSRAGTDRLDFDLAHSP